MQHKHSRLVDDKVLIHYIRLIETIRELINFENGRSILLATSSYKGIRRSQVNLSRTVLYFLSLILYVVFTNRNCMMMNCYIFNGQVKKVVQNSRNSRVKLVV